MNPKPKPQELAEVYKRFTAEFPVVTIEDPFDQDDWESYTKLTEVIVCLVCFMVGLSRLYSRPLLTLCAYHRR